jgi:hypothetical protein
MSVGRASAKDPTSRKEREKWGTRRLGIPISASASDESFSYFNCRIRYCRIAALVAVGQRQCLLIGPGNFSHCPALRRDTSGFSPKQLCQWRMPCAAQTSNSR